MIRKTVLTYVFVLIAILHGSAQSFELVEGDTVNVRDSNKKKQGWWKIFNEDGKYRGYDLGQLIEEGNCLNSKKTGGWIKYFPNGNKKYELTFANNIANGYAKIYYRSGQLREEGIWKMNRWSGQYKYYYENGNLKYDWNYNSSGKREGEQVYYHENGIPLYIGDWKSGNKAGGLVEYYEDGSVKSNRFFENGTMVPEKTENHASGKKYDENIEKYSGQPSLGQLERGEMVEGYNKLMNEDGKISKEGIFKNKKLIDGKAYHYENGQMITIVNYEGGKRIGEETIR